MSVIGSRTTGGLVKITVTSGGANYTSAPSVGLSGGGLTGASAYAVMNGTMVDSVAVANIGSGATTSPTVSFTGGGGSGAAATATVYNGSMRYLSFFKGRNNDVYGVDGMGRGVRWTGAATTAVQPIGINKPFSGLAVTATAGAVSAVQAVQMVNGGAGYNNIPDVSFSGSPTVAAQARAVVTNGRVSSVVVTNPGAGYTSTPAVSFSGGIGSGAVFGVGCTGGVARVRVTGAGSGYAVTSANSTFVGPSVVFNNTQGLTEAHAHVIITPQGKVSEIVLTSAGTGCTATGVTASISGGSGTGATLAVDQFFTVGSVTASNAGSGYMAAPVITFQAASNDPTGGGAAATCTVNTTGNISGVTILSGGTYSRPPTAVILDTTAKATATMVKALKGKYRCCYRFLDDTPEDQGGPIPSSISELKDIDCSSGSSSLNWPSIPTTGIDARVTAAELWRSTADQSVLLFRVATIQRADFAGTAGKVFTDSFSDKDLADSTRDGYGLMPITLPSGQINARRFEVPPGEMAIGVMFQDRAWYGVDTTGARPNTLMFSEIDEPESVPAENELVIQENTNDPDKLVALIPLGAMMLLAQTCHLYRLTYVAQPIIDAAVTLVSYRGILNNRCWDVLGGVAYIVDSNGMYAYDGQQDAAVSVPIDNLWRDKVIDFSKADKFHVRADPASQVVRFYYSRTGDAAPQAGNGEVVGVRALCYCVSTKAWWEETYPTAITSTCRLPLQNSNQVVVGTDWGSLCKPSSGVDAGWANNGTGSSAIPLTLRSGAMTIINEKTNSSITLLYTPTAADWDLTLNLAYNNSSTVRANAIYSDRGTGFKADTAGATLNMNKARSSLGDATGIATAYFSGGVDPRSSGADRHIAVVLESTAGTQRPVIHQMEVDGVQ